MAADFRAEEENEEEDVGPDALRNSYGRQDRQGSLQVSSGKDVVVLLVENHAERIGGRFADRKSY